MNRTVYSVGEAIRLREEHAWVRFAAAALKKNHVATAADIADHMLEKFRARFPAPVEREVEPTPTEPDWIDHTPGNPMPCEPGMRVWVRQRGGSEQKKLAKNVVWGRHAPSLKSLEIIQWKPAQ